MGLVAASFFLLLLKEINDEDDNIEIALLSLLQLLLNAEMLVGVNSLAMVLSESGEGDTSLLLVWVMAKATKTGGGNPLPAVSAALGDDDVSGCLRRTTYMFRCTRILVSYVCASLMGLTFRFFFRPGPVRSLSNKERNSHLLERTVR